MYNILTILRSYFQTKYLRKFQNREQLLKWQDKQVKKFLQEILSKSRFYRNYYQGLDISNWREFPIIDKSIMMENFDQLNTANITKVSAFNIASQAEKTRDFSSPIENFTVGLSSGTSGNRGLFIVSQAEQKSWAGILLAKMLPNLVGEGLKPIFPDYIRRSIIMGTEDIQEYLAIQKNPQLIEIFLKTPRDLFSTSQNKVNQSLLDLFERSHCQIPVIHYQEYPERNRHDMKLRRVKRDFLVDIS